MERAYIGIDGLQRVNYDSFAKRLFQIDEREAPVEGVVRVHGGLDWWITLNARDRGILDNTIAEIRTVILQTPTNVDNPTYGPLGIYVLQVQPGMCYLREPQIKLHATSFQQGETPLMAYMAVTIDKAHPKGTAEEVVEQLKEVEEIGDIAVIADGIKIGEGPDFPHDIMAVIGGYKDDIERIIIEQVQQMEGLSQTRTYLWVVPPHLKS